MLDDCWSVLDYLTKYAAKAGKGTQKLGKLFEDVLSQILSYEKADGMVDLWRRTIIKFYNRILGDRDYTLMETVHFGLRLPGGGRNRQNLEVMKQSQNALGELARG